MLWHPLLVVPLAALAQALTLQVNVQLNDDQIPVLASPVNTSPAKSSKTILADSLPTVDLGYTKHKAAKQLNDKLYFFRNIRYAEPPVGDLRFRAPQPPKKGKEGEVEDGIFKQECLQAMVKWADNFPDEAEDGGECCNEVDADGNCKVGCGSYERRKNPHPKTKLGGFIDSVTGGSEDCLYLDVWAPKRVFDDPDKTKYPVLVWIYGGAYIFGAKTLYFPGGLLDRSLAEEGEGMIFVSMNYRMGALGFAAGEEIGDKDVNAGLLDQQQALKWVKEHISKFGGDPDQVTIAGLSAGGGSVMHHITAYKGKGENLFRRAISLSGGWQPVVNRTRANDTFNEFKKLAGAKDIAELRKLPQHKLREANAQQIAEAPPGSFLYNPTGWGDFAPETPAKALSSGNYREDVELLLSHVFDEGSKFTAAFKDKNTTLPQFLDLALPDLEEDEREFVVDWYNDTVAAEHAKIGEIIGDATFRCPVTWFSNAYRGNVFRQRWNTFKSNGHGGDLLYLFYQPFYLVRSVRSALILQDYAVFFTLYGFPFTTVTNPKGGPADPASYQKQYKDNKLQNLDSSPLHFPVVTRESPDRALEHVCNVWQQLTVT